VIAAVDADSETARLINDAGCGEVVPPQDAPRLVQAISALRDEPARRAGYGRSGRSHLEQHYAKDIALSRYVSVFNRALSGEAA
jgi:colanic acid biosynthesis glycosyl transferase WcaI